ncbi:MAG: hypothetical protein PHE32_02230 [Candidatus Shapirobacteria bacterium]|nr:hypothetical protein [Candidatus Shapirobacteria bacterium]MDD4410488.1 hypothetical protein [Candidatus Shapirobacteria bacterium]
MIKKILIALLCLFNIFAIVYLVSPTPTLPDLVNSVRSDEPGDTIQLKNVSAYYTNMTRTEVMNFYKAYYSGSFRIIINHPPEKAKEIIRDTIQSYYFEEYVLPFKESLYINGFEWENDVFTLPEKRIKNKLIFKDKEYKAKITIKTIPTSIPKRITAFLFTEGTLIFAFCIYKSFLKKKK